MSSLISYYRRVVTEVTSIGANGKPSTPISSTSVINSFSVTADKSKVGNPNPGWRGQIARHQDATTTFVASNYGVSVKGRGSWTTELRSVSGGVTTNTVYRGEGFLPVPSDAANIDSSLAQKAFNGAMSKAFKAVLGMQQHVQGGAFLGEIREAIHMIRHPAESLSSFILGEQYLSTKTKLMRAGVRRGRPIKGSGLERSLTRAASDAWLEARFGWLPLISDIKGAAEGLAALAVDPEYMPFRVSYSARSNGSVESSPGWSVEGPTGYDILIKRDSFAKVFIYGEVKQRATVPANNLDRISSNFGLNVVRDFVPTVWELLPYSFLVDYFANIGDVLAGCFVNLDGVSRCSMSRSNRTRVRNIVQNFHNVGAGGVSCSGSHPTVVISRASVDRITPVSIQAPRLQFSFPSSPIKWANMGALIGGRYKGISWKQ